MACAGAACKLQVIISSSCGSSLRRGGGQDFTSCSAHTMSLMVVAEENYMSSRMSYSKYLKLSSARVAAPGRNAYRDAGAAIDQFLMSCKSLRRFRLHLGLRQKKIYRMGGVDSVAVKAGLLDAFGLEKARGELLNLFGEADGGARHPPVKGELSILRPLVAAMTSLIDQKNIEQQNFLMKIEDQLGARDDLVQMEVEQSGSPELMTRATSMPVQQRKVNGTSSSLQLLRPAELRLIDYSSEEGSRSLIEDGILYRQNFVIRSYEVDANRTAKLETLTNLFQEAALNHVWLSGIGSDGFGTTIQMKLNDLIWVVNRMHVEVDRYPKWGDVVEIESWVGASGKNGMRRDWIVRDFKNRQVLARSTSTWVMMNQTTRKLSKMPEQVRAEVSPYYVNRFAIPEQRQLLSIPKLDDSADHIRSGLTPRRSDLDMNQHVNNVKYINWMMESVPASLVETHEVSSITMQYRRECGPSDVLQSLTSPTDELQHLQQEVLPFESHPPKPDLMSSSSSNNKDICVTIDDNHDSEVGDDDDADEEAAGSWQFSSVERTLLTAFSSNPSWLNYEPFHFAHLLRTQKGAAEIVRGKTIWKLKKTYNIQSEHSNRNP